MSVTPTKTRGASSSSTDLAAAGMELPLAVNVGDCRFRLPKSRERLCAQHVDDSYIVTANKSEQPMRAANAGSAYVARWLRAPVPQALS